MGFLDALAIVAPNCSGLLDITGIAVVQEVSQP